MLLPLLLLAGCGDRPAVRGTGHIVAETRPVGPFRSIYLAGFAELVVTPGPAHTVEVHAEDNVQPLLTATVTPDGVLELGYVPGASVRPRQTVLFGVSAPALERITRAGVGGVRVNGPFPAKSFELSAAGAGEIVFDRITADELTLRLSGEGTVTATGTVGRLRLLLQDGANPFAAKLSGLTAGRAEVTLAGGEASVRATEALMVTARRGGRVRYTGTPMLTVIADDPDQVRPE